MVPAGAREPKSPLHLVAGERISPAPQRRHGRTESALNKWTEGRLGKEQPRGRGTRASPRPTLWASWWAEGRNTEGNLRRSLKNGGRGEDAAAELWAVGGKDQFVTELEHISPGHI